MKNITVICILILITVFAFFHFRSMQPIFKAGDHVTVMGSPHMSGQKTGVVNVVEPYAYGITFDDMETKGIHKWYSQSELK